MTFDLGELSIVAMQEQAAAEPEMYYIQKIGHCGGALRWVGYDSTDEDCVISIDKAKQFTREEALKIIASGKYKLAFKCSDIHRTAKMVVMLEAMGRREFQPLALEGKPCST